MELCPELRELREKTLLFSVGQDIMLHCIQQYMIMSSVMLKSGGGSVHRNYTSYTLFGKNHRDYDLPAGVCLPVRSGEHLAKFRSYYWYKFGQQVRDGDKPNEIFKEKLCWVHNHTIIRTMDVHGIVWEWKYPVGHVRKEESAEQIERNIDYYNDQFSKVKGIR